MIEQLLQNKTAKEKANIKALEIAKLNFTGVYTDSNTGIKVEIKDGKVYQYENGIYLYARAWKGVDQLGFGDGTIEWDKFRFNNPPIMVDDPNGNVIRSWTDIDGKLQQRKLREDPLAAIRSTLAHTIKVVPSKTDGKIIKDKLGSTHTTYQPQAGEGGANTTTDAYVGPNAQNVVWATIRDNATGAITDGVNGTNPFVQAFGSATSNQWKRLFRSIVTFPTTDIDAGDTITAAVLSLAGTSKSDLQSNLPNIDVYKFVTTGNNNLVTTSDYLEANGMGSTSQTGSPITFANWSTTGYNDFTFNATGRSNINKATVSGFALRNANYDVANVAPTWGNDDTYSITGSYADTAGTASDPKLVVTHGVAAVAGYPPTLLFMNAG